MKISCNVNTRDAILNFCCLLYLIGRLICSEWINTCVPTLSMKRHLFRSFAYNEFIHPHSGSGSHENDSPVQVVAVKKEEKAGLMLFVTTTRW